jgi:hypothetical protein
LTFAREYFVTAASIDGATVTERLEECLLELAGRSASPLRSATKLGPAGTLLSHLPPEALRPKNRFIKELE